MKMATFTPSVLKPGIANKKPSAGSCSLFGSAPMSPPPATASAEGRQFYGAPFPATAWAEGGQFNGSPSLRVRVRVRGFTLSRGTPRGWGPSPPTAAVTIERCALPEAQPEGGEGANACLAMPEKVSGICICVCPGDAFGFQIAGH
jgi:hypothetical protein